MRDVFLGYRLIVGLAVCGALSALSGCTSSTSAPTAAGAKVLLDEEPSEPGGIVDLKSALITGLAPAGRTTIAGRVVSGQDWETDQASFLVRDLQADSDHEHDHGAGDHSDCAFCQAKEKQTGAMALLRVVDEQGKTFEMDARELLGLEENQVVVADGAGEIDDDGTLVFAASKIYIRND